MKILRSNQAGPDASASRKMRVLFVSPVSDLKGGAERVLLDLLSNSRLEPVLAVPEHGELSVAVERHNVPIAYYHPKALVGVHRPPRLSQMAAALVDAFRCALRIRRVAREQRCELLHTNGLKAHAIGAILNMLFGIRVLVHFHDIPYNRLERMIWRMIGRLATRVIVVSQSCWPGPATEKVVVLQNGIRSPRLMPHVPLPLYRLRLGFVGRYHPHKGLDLLLDWVNAARAAGLDITLVMRGRPDVDHFAYWERIRSRIKAEGLASIVTDQGWQPTAAAYDDIDFLLIPSKLPDPAPLVILEAMTAGVVVIGYPAGGIPQLVPSGSGTLARTPAEFVTALRGYLETPDLYKQVRATAYRHVKIAHDPEVLALRFASICQSALSTASRKTSAISASA